VVGTAEPASTLCYSVGAGSFVVRAAMTDTLAGLASVAFPAIVSPGRAYPQGGAHQAAASSFTGVSLVTATDRAGNPATATFRLMRDATPPIVIVDATVQGSDVVVTWGDSSDADSGIATYDLYLQVDDGNWQPILLQTQSTSYQLTAQPDEVYTFRVTATDNVGNQASAEATSGLPRVTKYYYHGGKRVAMRTPEGVFYLHGDHLDSTSLTTDENGEVVSRQLYHPFGTVRYTEGANPTDFGFAGQRHDGTGLVFMRARYYDPLLARFASADTIVPEPGNPQGLNRFAYVGNNPVRYVDPSGHLPHAVIGALAGAFIGAAVGAGAEYVGQVAWNLVQGESLGKALTTAIDTDMIIASAAGGAVQGAIVGAIDVGTVGIGAVAAGGLGGAAGGAVTQLTYNALTGNDLGAGVGGAAIVGGVIGAATFGIGSKVPGANTLLGHAASGAILGAPCRPARIC
jgi:RHS repeat-associated protein